VTSSACRLRHGAHNGNRRKRGHLVQGRENILFSTTSRPASSRALLASFGSAVRTTDAAIVSGISASSASSGIGEALLLSPPMLGEPSGSGAGDDGSDGDCTDVDGGSEVMGSESGGGDAMASIIL
jgi:hypothetical protein